MQLCDATSALGVALVDAQGETVDYAAMLDPFDVKVAAAEWRIVLKLVRSSNVALWSGARQMIVRSQRKTFATIALEEGYAIVLVMHRHAFAISGRALGEAVRELSREAGLSLPAGFDDGSERWSRVDVRTLDDDPRRPQAIWHRGAWHDVVILGHYSARSKLGTELGYRARLRSGAELTIVREPLGRWYVDENP